jgi:hypothetical protein
MEPPTVENRVAATANTETLASGCGWRNRIRPLALGPLVPGAFTGSRRRAELDRVAGRELEGKAVGLADRGGEGHFCAAGDLVVGDPAVQLLERDA